MSILYSVCDFDAPDTTNRANRATTADTPSMDTIREVGRNIRRQIIKADFELNALLSAMRCGECGHTPRMKSEGIGPTIWCCAHLYSMLKNCIASRLWDGPIPLGALRVMVEEPELASTRENP